MKCIQWHDRLTLLRNALFLILPPTIHFILAPSPPSQTNPLSTLPTTIATLDRALTRLYLAKYTRSAILRVSYLRESAIRWWETEAREGRAVREDEGVKKAARAQGMAFDEKVERAGEEEEEGPLRRDSRTAVGGLLQGLQPSEFWRPAAPPTTG